jgi:hypothetical protein
MNMAKKERNTGSVGRARAKRGSAGDMSAEEFEASLARRRAASSFDEQTQNEDFFRGSSAEDTMKMLRGPTRPMPRPSRGMESSPRPMTRPDDLAERAERRKAEDAAGAALRASRREAADMDMQNFVEGGMVRGCKPGQMSGKKFSGTF